MADFLTRLAGRTLGLAATIQPIIAPMYAAGQQFVGAEDAQVETQDAWGATNREMGAINQISTADKSAMGAINQAPTDRLPDEAPPGNLVGQPATWHQISLEREHDGRRERPHPTSISGVGFFGTPPAAEKESEAWGIPPNPRQWRRPWTPLPQNLPVSNPESTAPPREEAEVGHDGRPQGSPSLREESGVGYDGRRKRPHPTSTPPPSLRGPLVGHSFNQGNQREVAPVTQEPSAPVPTIQVMIGRIEVRAMPPPAPRSQPRRSEPPVMGLEEYLNQRAKGGY